MDLYSSVVVVTALMLLATETQASVQLKIMSNHCSKTVEVSDSLVVLLVPPRVLRPGLKLDAFHCRLDLLAPEGHGLLVHFLHVSISPDHKDADRLHLYEMDSNDQKTMLTPDQGLYGMLDRSILSNDYEGANIDDYSTWQRRLRFDYLGRPTQKYSGFRALVTVVSKPEKGNSCPSKTTKCSLHPYCISAGLICDGYPNCGHQDQADEMSCNPEMVTSLLDKYSLVYDIVVVTCVPVLVFLIFVTLVFCLTKRHLKKSFIRKEAPAVSYSADDGDRVQVYDDSYDPPSYSEVVSSNQATRLTKPPAYSSLEAMELAGTVIIESDDDHRSSGRAGRRHRTGRLHRASFRASDSSLDSCQSLEIHRMRSAPPKSTRPALPHYDSSDDEETKRRQRRKGGKCKSKGKRRADDLCPDSATATTTDQRTTAAADGAAAASDFPPSSSHPALSSASSASKLYSPSVPYVSHACPSLSVASLQTSSSSFPASSSPSPPPLGMKSSPSTGSESGGGGGGGQPEHHGTTFSSSSSRANADNSAVLPVYENLHGKKVKAKAAVPEDVPHSDSSGVEADRKSEPESGLWNRMKNDPKTESCSSLSEIRESPIPRKTIGIQEEEQKKKGKSGHKNEVDEANHKNGKGDDWGKSMDEEDRKIEDVYNSSYNTEGVINGHQGGYEIDLHSKDAVAVHSKGSSVV